MNKISNSLSNREGKNNMKSYKAGIDVGSTTVKLIVFDEEYQLLFSRYERHFSDVKMATIKVLKELLAEQGECTLTLAITGSGARSMVRIMAVSLLTPWAPASC